LLLTWEGEQVVGGIEVIIVNWNSGAYLGRALDSLGRQRGVQLHVTVVDNASTDGSLERARAQLSLDFEVVQTGRNLGYTGGNNVGFKVALEREPSEILVMNPDLQLVGDACLSRLADGLRANATAGAMGPAIIRPSGALEYTGSMIELSRARAVHTQGGERPAHPVPIEWLDGAFLLFNADALRDVGGFDERYFLLFEEVDWCIRARAQGWALLFDGGAEVAHDRSQSFTGSHKAGYYYWRNLYLLCTLHAPGRGWKHHYLTQLARHCLRRGSPLAERAQCLSGAWDAKRERFGVGRPDHAG
jgi:GT2 family glycosyltransferase